ncbi:MAG: hypothetical protein IBJ11_08995 [Phycisphaerales bacterium]|nr:hypothetical protein [Phycisphaerales bacterium]
MNPSSAIVRFLGPVDVSLGPYGILRLPVGDTDEADVAAAAADALARVDAHPQARSAEAEEVRLAIHVAAAQIRDAAVRAALIARLAPRAGAASPAEAPPPPAPGPVGGAGADDDLFRQLILAELAHAGGLNPDGLRRLGALAHVYGLSQSELVRLLNSATHASPAAAASGAGQPPAAVRPFPAAPRRAALAWATVALVAMSAVMLTGFVVVIVRRAAGITGGAGEFVATPTPTPTPAPGGAGGVKSSAAPTGPTAPAAGTAAGQQAPPPGEPVRPRADAAPTDPAELAPALRRAADLIPERPAEALAAFLGALDGLYTLWPDLPPELARAIAADVAAFLSKAGRAVPGNVPDDAARAVAAPARRLFNEARPPEAGAVRPGVYAAGLVARLSRDASLPGPMGELFRSAAAPLGPQASGEIPGEVWPAAALALRATVDRLLEAWKRSPPMPTDAGVWAQVLAAQRAVSAGEASVGAGFIEACVKRVLVEGPPAQAFRPTGEALAALLPALAWREKPAAAARLLAWFDDPAVPTSNLAFVSDWIVRNAAVSEPADPPLDYTYSLASDAPAGERTRVRDQFARYLGAATTEAAPVATAWSERAGQLLAVPAPSAADEALLLAAVLAKVNEAALHRCLRDDRAADQALAAADRDRAADHARAQTQQRSPNFKPELLTSPGVTPDGEWALRFRRAPRQGEARVVLINELRQQGGPRGPVDAAVLAEAALRPGSPTVQRAAASAVEDRLDDPTVRYALLDVFADAPRTTILSDLAEKLSEMRLPPPATSGWKPAVHRAILGTVLASLIRQEVAGPGILRVDPLSDILRQAYESMAAAVTRGVRTERGPQAAPPAAPRGRLGSVPTGPGTGSPFTVTYGEAGSGPPDAAREAARVFDALAGEARRLPERKDARPTLEEIEKRRAMRRSLAAAHHSPVADLACEQASLAELLGYLAAGEHPGKAEQVRAVLREMSAERRRAGHVFLQILAGERAIARLWAIRLGDPLP